MFSIRARFFVCLIVMAMPGLGGENIDLHVNLTLNNGVVSTIGKAYYRAPTFCLDGCYMWGTHQVQGGVASNSWIYETSSYEEELSQQTTEGDCYRGKIEAWGSVGFHGVKISDEEKCEKRTCTLTLQTSGSGSVSGAPLGQSTCDCDTTTFSLSAEPATGSYFAGWTGSMTLANPSITFLLDANKQLTANFEQDAGSPGPGNVEPDCTDSPILLNMGKGSYELTGLDDRVLFDIRGQGQPTLTTWTARDVSVAFLALDRNGNGSIDSGAELFGDATRLESGHLAPNGFLALAEFDSNEDGLINGLDPIWIDLLLWTDLNHNGLTDSGELQRLSESEVTEISLTAHWTGRRDEHGNTFRYQGTMKLGNRARPIYDVWFVTSQN
ncbi:MAG TPA: hypothetical protein VMS12_03940 [Thermoanaerobaculia bacterium]|nr:hypothetical protein [Thermoanaerobaculia bacterium]